MNLEELRSVQRAERQKDSLQHLRDSFYEDVAAYIAQLKDERERAVANADDPFASEDVRRLTDELESTKEIANAVYERRVGKVVKHASFAAADMNTDEEGMTTEERALFEDLVERIKESRKSVFATLDGRADVPVDDSPAADEPSTDPEPEPASTTADEPSQATDDGLMADALGGAPDTDDAPPTGQQPDQPVETEPEAAPSADDDGRPHDEASAVLGDDPGEPAAAPSSATGTSTAAESERDHERESETEHESEAGGPVESEPDTADPDRATVRITADVGTVYGVDEREYDLAREDVVMLPTTNAEPLVQKNAAERID